MGMFDEIRCEYPLPDAAMQDATFQTKSFDRDMTHYTITADGQLIHHTVQWESVPEEERPYYGRPEWDKPFLRVAGSIKTIPTWRFGSAVSWRRVLQYFARRAAG